VRPPVCALIVRTTRPVKSVSIASESDSVATSSVVRLVWRPIRDRDDVRWCGGESPAPRRRRDEAARRASRFGRPHRSHRDARAASGASHHGHERPMGPQRRAPPPPSPSASSARSPRQDREATFELDDLRAHAEGLLDRVRTSTSRGAPSAITRPSASTTMRSAQRAARVRSCSTAQTARPSTDSARSTSSTGAGARDRGSPWARRGAAPACPARARARGVRAAALPRRACVRRARTGTPRPRDSRAVSTDTRSWAARGVPRCGWRPSSTSSRTVMGTSRCVSWSTSVARRAISMRARLGTPTPPSEPRRARAARGRASRGGASTSRCRWRRRFATRAPGSRRSDTSSSTVRAPRTTLARWSAASTSAPDAWITLGSSRVRSRRGPVRRGAP
jgi:hypothetical protein